MAKNTLGPWTLVTGSAGFIAFHLIEKCLREKIPVLGIDNFDPFYSTDLKQRNTAELLELSRKVGTPFEFLQDDILRISPDWFRNRDIRCVVHLAARAGVRNSLRDPFGYLNTNVVGTLKMLEFCKQRRVGEMVLASSSSVYGNDSVMPFREDQPAMHPISPYAVTKRSAELLAFNHAHHVGLRVAALRFFTVYGPRQRPDLAVFKFADAIHHEQPITVFGDGSTERDYTYVSDTVDGVVSAMKWIRDAKHGSYEIFNLAAGRLVKLDKLIELLEGALGKKAQRKPADKQPGDVDRTFADISKAGEILKYAPKIMLEEGVQKFAQWYLAHRQEWPKSRAA